MSIVDCARSEHSEFGESTEIRHSPPYSIIMYSCYDVTCYLTIIKSFRHAYITNPVIPLVLALRLSALTEVLHNSCNMGTRDLPEMYARSPRAVPSDFGYTFLANHLCPCYNYKIKFVVME